MKTASSNTVSGLGTATLGSFAHGAQHHGMATFGVRALVAFAQGTLNVLDHIIQCALEAASASVV